MSVDRRSFVQFLGGAAVASGFPDSIARALSIGPNGQTGTIADVEHIVILMQENRSFDHYFGTLKGVRGFGDPRAVTLPSGNPVWCQPNGGGYTLPFRPTAPELGMQFLQDLPHDWTTTHAAWNGGKNDSWVPNKGPVTMAHLQRADIPFHYALADAFTVCDAYYSSLLGPTYPNRYHMWTGWTGNDGKAGGPAVDNNSPANGFSWLTLPEQLEKAGISWKIYQDQGGGLDAAHNWGGDDNGYVGNYSCNSLLRFNQYQNAAPGSPLYQKARTGTNVAVHGSLFDILRADALGNKMPQVSWVVAPEAYTEHPNWPANYGAWYVSQILDALTANPTVWSKTAFFITYDENDGFFDHVVPPTPPMTRAAGLSSVATTGEIFAGNSGAPAGPYGLGIRVPMLVVSPWSTGGWVNSDVFDHTSLIRFIQARFGASNAALTQSNITPWRKAVTGDLTSAFNFAHQTAAPSIPAGTLPSTPPDNPRQPNYSPSPPSQQAMPIQEPGTRPASGLAYTLNAFGAPDFANGAFDIAFSNTGLRTAVFQVRSGNTQAGPWSYTVQPQAKIADTWQVTGHGAVAYDFSVYGPNGFFRAFKGEVANKNNVNLQSWIVYNVALGGVTLETQNLGTGVCQLSIKDLYNNQTLTPLLKPNQTFTKFWPLNAYFGWYNLVITVASDANFRQQLAGHLETGLPSMTDPAIATAV